MKQQVKFIDLGLIDYKECWNYQEYLFQENISQKIKQRTISGYINNRQSQKKYQDVQTTNYLLFCEHPHVYTLGKNGNEKNLLLNKFQLENKNATYYKINRGGDITYHGPGQIVGYPILDLDNFFTDIRKYLHSLEEIIILTLNDYGIESGRIAGLTGVWADWKNPNKAKKICALGVRTSRWVTMHGFAFNINSDLSYFDNIIPCGISDKELTSMEKELKKKMKMKEVKEKVKKYFTKIFECEMVEMPFCNNPNQSDK